MIIKKSLALAVILLFISVSVIPSTAGFSDVSVSMLVAGMEASGLMSNKEQVAIRYDDLPDLTIELNITSKFMHWRVRATIHNKGTATIPAGTPIVWKLEEDEDSLSWVKVTPFYPFEPNMSIPGLPESKKLEFNKLRWRDHEITAIIDPPYEEDYPWKELDPDPIYGLIIESNEDNNFDSYVFPKIFSFSMTKTITNKFEYMSSFLTAVFRAGEKISKYLDEKSVEIIYYTKQK